MRCIILRKEQTRIILAEGYCKVFSPETILQAWERSAGQCECEKRIHKHFYTPCGKSLVWKAKGSPGQGGWDAHKITPSGGDGLFNCEILCWDCYRSVTGYLASTKYSDYYQGPTQQVQIGDYIRLESGDEGRVTEISYDSVHIKTVDGVDTVVSNSEIRRIITNYGQSSKQAKDPFRFYNLAVIKKLTGLKAKNLNELVDNLEKVPDSVIYYHTHQFLQEHHYLNPEPANDFAIWVTDSLGDNVLGERLANVNPFSFRDLEGIRETLINIIEEHLSQHANHREALEGREFYFIKSARFIFPTPYVAHDLREFVGVLRNISLGSLYFHIFESRLKSVRGLNDFSLWLIDSLGEEETGRIIACLDPYTYTLEGLRSSLITLLEKSIK